MTLRTTLDFLLHEWLDTMSLTNRERFTDHNRETFDAVLDTCERIAREKYAPFNRLIDLQEPHFDGEKLVLPQAAQEYELGAMQLPCSVGQFADCSWHRVAKRSVC